MRNLFVFIALIGVNAAAHTESLADAGSWSVQIGPGYIDFHEQAAIDVGGMRVPGAGLNVEGDATLLAEVTYHFTPSWSAGVTLGIPPVSDVSGTGTAAAFGKLGSVRYGPLALIGKYTLNTHGAWHPYVGAGAVYYVILGEHDGFINDLQVDNRFGIALQSGIRYDLSPHVGLFFDFKKLFIKTEANGNLPALGGAPVHADVKLDPAAFHFGSTFNF